MSETEAGFIAGGMGGRETPPSLDAWLREAKAHPDACKVGMYLTHNGVVRATAKAQVREGAAPKAVVGLVFSYEQEKVEESIRQTFELPGVYYVRAWLNHGELRVGDDLMYVLVGGDIRPHTADALQFLVEKLKTQCVTERELCEE